MAEEIQLIESGSAPRKRRVGKKQGGKKSSKKPKMMLALQGQKKVKIDKKMKKLFRKRVQEYNSDDDDESAAPAIIGSRSLPSILNKSHNEEDIENEEFSEEEEGGDEVRSTDPKLVHKQKLKSKSVSPTLFSVLSSGSSDILQKLSFPCKAHAVSPL